MGGRGSRNDIEGEKIDCLLIDHGGNYDLHGPLDEEIIWTLDDKEKAWSKKNKSDRIARPIKCSFCNLVFENLSECPDCGNPVKSFGRPVEVVKATLKEVGKKATTADKRIYLGMLKYWVPLQKNPNPKRILGMFRGRYNVWPHHSYINVDPIKPDEVFLNYIKHERIKYARRRK